MPPIFDKLNLKHERELLVCNAPLSFEPHLAALADVTVHRSASACQTVGFALVFETRQAELDAMCATLCAKAEGDATLWIAFPKQSSRRYRCEFGRDTGWHVLAGLGYEPVRMVAIDDDWCALRFRKIEFIKSFTRDAARAGTVAGKRRATAR